MHTSPQIHQTHKTHDDSKVYFLQRQIRLSLNYSKHNPSHVRRYVLLSQLSHNSISSPYSQPFPMRLAAQTQTTFSMLQIKTILKNTFQIRTSWTFSLYIPKTLSEETTQRKHTHILQPILAQQYKQKLWLKVH